jgi:ABC-type bacteriocin/lantibiotic exporter with double-glycine peptidase domain
MGKMHKKYAAAFFIIILSSFVFIFQNIILVYFFDRWIGRGLNNIDILIIVLFILTLLAYPFLKYFEATNVNGIIIELIKNYVKKITKSLLNSAYNSFIHISHADIIEIINNDLLQIIKIVDNNLYSIASQTMIFVMALIFMMYISLEITLITVLLTLFTIAGSLLLSRRIKNVQNMIIKTNIEYNEYLYEVSRSKNYNRFLNINNFDEIMRIKNNELKKYYSKADSLKYIMQTLLIIQKRITVVVTVLFAARLLKENAITIGEMAALLRIQVFFLSSSNSLTGISNTYHILNLHLARIRNIINIKSEDYYTGRWKKDAAVHYIINISKLEYGYNDIKILDDLNLMVKKGQKVLIKGESGSGKSTLLRLICGFDKKYNGSIKLYGNESTDSNIIRLRNNISYFNQDVFILNGTLMENLFLKDNSVCDDMLIKYLELLKLDKLFIQNGRIIDSTLEHLSEGEKQRVALLRLLLHDNGIFIFDEPTANMDAENEYVFQDLINSLDKTVIIVSHRSLERILFDNCYSMDNGRLVEISI